MVRSKKCRSATEAEAYNQNDMAALTVLLYSISRHHGLVLTCGPTSRRNLTVSDATGSVDNVGENGMMKGSSGSTRTPAILAVV